MELKYTKEQQSDIQDRMKKGNEYLASIGLQVAVTIVPYLQDTTFTHPDGSLKEIVETVPDIEAIPVSENASAPIMGAIVNPAI